MMSLSPHPDPSFIGLPSRVVTSSFLSSFYSQNSMDGHDVEDDVEVIPINPITSSKRRTVKDYDSDGCPRMAVVDL